jgi:hypothetical protein
VIFIFGKIDTSGRFLTLRLIKTNKSYLGPCPGKCFQSFPRKHFSEN